ncbi:hypothetical protein RN001_009326 [Aquatica leii]|uniref:Nucleoprotein TPR n=1 Tax=Aquatica leii TaxID=1421715 RepID=A0AAN7NZF5_9COLE|nr:hypothetical protein RN001_009326 [Aquatica leii]
MEETDSYRLFASAVSEDEWSQIPSEIAKKIHVFVEGKFEDLITNKALSETNKFNTETDLKEVNEKFKTAETNLNDTNSKLEAATRTIAELESQISIITSDLNKLQTTCNQLEAEAADCRHQKNIALGEKDELAKMLERSKAEVERQQMEFTTLTNQLHNAVNAKCNALAEVGEIESLKLALEYKEKRLDQERNLLNHQVETLTKALNERTEELLNMKKDNSLRCVQLENKLTEKTMELSVAYESLRSLTEINKTLTSRIEELMEDLKKEKEQDYKAQEIYQHEIAAQTKLAELYKNAGDQNKEHADQLSQAVSELQMLLRETTNKYGDLETKHKEMQLANEEIISKKNECIAMLKHELETSNELFKAFKDETVQKEVEEISPSAAAASKFIKPGMSLTQIYTQYMNVTTELTLQKEECSRLQSYIQHIVNELEDKGPLLKKQREDYETAMDNIKEVTENNYSLALECQQIREESLQYKRNADVLLRENERFKKEVTDLSRQVCHLLREIELSRVGSNATSPEQDMSDSMSSGEIISKRLVTFSDITELQSTNQRLLSLVRELTSKQEEAESLDPAAIAQLKMKLETMKETQGTLLEQQENQNKMMGMVIGQRDMYKTLYEQAVKGIGEDIPMQLERPYIPEGERGSQSSKANDDADSRFDDKAQELENQLEKAKKEIEVLKEENETYRKEKSANEKILLEQMEDMRKEVREVTRQNCKLSSVSEVNDEKFKILQSNVEVYKKQLSALEKQNKIYNDSIIKHEQMVSFLRDETLEAQTKLSTAEVRLANLEKENALLRDRESRLAKEVEFLKKDSLSKNLLQTNIELIKATLERNDAESRIRLEERLDEAYRECAALRRRLQEEQDRFRELGDHLEKQTRAAQTQMEEEKTCANKLREEVAQTREELMAKQIQIEELTKKLKSSLMTIPENSVESHKFRELERMLSDSQAEVQSLQQMLKNAKESIDQHSNVAEGAEKQLKTMLDEQENYKKSMEAKLKEKEACITKLEEQCSELQGELSIQTDDASAMDLGGKLRRLEEEFKTTKSDLEDSKKELAEAQEKIKQLTADVETAENKYTREMLLHSTDLQALTTVKEELAQLSSEVQEVKHARDQAIAALQENNEGSATREEFFQKEKEQLEVRFKDLDNQNALLLDQIQSLNAQISIVQAQATEQSNQSVGSIGDISFNRSFTEEEVKSSEQLLKIIKYLRQEKDIAVSKCEILDAELLRLKSQHDLICKQLEDAKANLETERQKSEVSMVTAAKHSEILRKVETLNAITDSNRSLRQERDTLMEEMNDLKKRTSLLEEQVVPLQEKNKELSLKYDALHSENVTLRGDATRWRQRANMLIEKSNRTSPEDWKKLQNERENLVKQLAIEKGATAKLGDELSTIRHEKTKLEEQLRALRLQHTQVCEELEHAKSELAKVKDQVSQFTHELEQTKENYTKLIEDKSKIESDLAQKSETVRDLKNNLLAVRKIAKKYKQQCEELTAAMDALKLENEEKSKNDALTAEKQQQLVIEERTELQERMSQLEQTHNEKIEQLTLQINTANEETNTYKKEIEGLKQSSLEKEDRFKNLFKTAKERIVTLTEQNNNLRSELHGSKSSELNEVDKSSEVEKLMKEKEEILFEKQQEKDRLTSEIETLTQRVAQLQRQLGQQSSKPTTSSGASEKSSTEPPTANIKPMAGHSTNTQTQSVQIQPWRSGPETPLASIRPMSMQLRTVAVLPTSQGPSTSQSPSAVMVPPQQVHTTGPSNIEALSSSPTSSHTEYMPATSSATPTVVGPRQVAVPPTQSTQDTEDDDTTMQLQPVLQQQAVALVLPRVEQPSNGPAQESGTSSSSSNTVTTTQAGLKRPRDVDTDSCQVEEQSKIQQQAKRTRVQQGTTEQSHGTVTDSGLEVEYQVPTSSQRDHEEDTDAVIVVESDEDGDGPDEGEGEDDDGDDPDTEGYDMEAYPEQELSYDDADCQDMEEEEGGNEVEVVEDSSEVPNQSERSMQETSSQEECLEQPQSEAISSGTDGPSSVTVSQASPSVAVTMPSFSRTRSVAPLTRQQQAHLLLQHGMDEGGDDGIVPSTPTLFVPRRSDGFGEAVSSPHVPTSGRFTFNESAPSNNSGSTEVVPEQTLEFSHTDDNSTGRSVPSTPLQASPQESGPAGEEHSSQQSANSEPEIPIITVSGVTEEAESRLEAGLPESMGPPNTASGESSEAAEQHVEAHESEDGVTSEGEKPHVSEESEEEGREAEASPSTNTRSRSQAPRGVSVARRSVRYSQMRGGVSRPSPTPIVWNDQHHSTRHQQSHRGRNQGNFQPRVAKRSRVRGSRSPYGRF